MDGLVLRPELESLDVSKGQRQAYVAHWTCISSWQSKVLGQIQLAERIGGGCGSFSLLLDTAAQGYLMVCKVCAKVDWREKSLTCWLVQFITVREQHFAWRMLQTFQQ